MSDEKYTLSEYRRAAVAGVHPDQLGIRREGHWVAEIGEDVLFGYVPSLLELHIYLASVSEDDHEKESLIREMEDRESTYRVLAEIHTVNQPDDWVSFIHRRLIWPISADLYEAAREVQWDAGLLTEQTRAEVDEALRALEDHRQRVWGSEE